MRKEFLIGLLLVFLFTMYSGSTPTESPGVDPIAFEQADEVILNAATFETINLAEVVMVPGLSLQVATTDATREQGANLETGRLENIKSNRFISLYICSWVTTRGPQNITATDKFTLNHKLYEISPGDIAA